MPIQLSMWRIDKELTPIPSSRLDRESRLEEILEQDPSILGLDVLIIGRQVKTAFGKRIDLIAIDSEGHLFAIEIKRNKTPREIVAQLLDYGSWLASLSYEQIVQIYSSDSQKQAFEQAFSERFDQSPPEELNEQHQLIVVASELDNSTERIISYLSELHGVPINAVFFRYFKDGSHEYLARTWLIDPNEVEARTGDRRKETWNGKDYYVALGEGNTRSWDDCVKYGFVSGGGGRWYSRTLNQLNPEDRIFVCIPGTGYVGVGMVKETAQRVKDFMVEFKGKSKPILQVPLKANLGKRANDPEKSEYVVRVQWIKTLPKEKAIWEKGMFANQNTACKLRNKFTLDTLIDRFNLAE